MYCTAEDIRGELYLPLIKQMETRFGTGFDAFLEGHAVKATDYINAQLAGRFPVPFRVPPSIIVSVAAKLAAYFAIAQFSEREELSEDKYKAAKEMLAGLRDAGHLPGEILPPGNVRGGSLPQVFTDDELAGW
nr:phage protein Gp36 family protein [uncultured Dethiosulfovibrio sp.]